MADTTVSSANLVQQWDNDYFLEYIRGNRFNRYMGTDANSIIHLNETLTNKPGTQVTIPLITRLKGQGVSGNSVLEGREEQLSNYGHKITTNVLRNGVVIDWLEEQKSELGLRNAAKAALKMWSMEDLRGANGNGRGIIDAFGSFRSGDTITNYASTSESVKDAFLAANSDRYLFGAAKVNGVSLDHSTALATVDSTNDKLIYQTVSLAKRIAKTADPHIRPVRVSEDEEWYVMFAPSLAFRDLKTSLATINQNAQVRGDNNPLFRDGDLTYDGVIVREVPELPVVTGVGNGGIDVAASYLCGAQAIGVAWAQRPVSKTQETDYQFRHGVAIQEMRGVEKLIFNGKQHGIVTIWTSAVGD
jgi:Protein of unknown function (DUF4043)